MALLTAQQQQTIKDWLKNKAPKSLKCPVCQQKNWKFSDRLVHLIGEGLTDNDLTKKPCVVLSCGDCAYLLFFFAGDLGV
jgi:hypothetical protein